ncbi:MAG TPA: SURF1 family cytochrome oxidase biogenesis protein, partial [Actinomycetota bacterium]|nr:SURF1 family cytochrome oxidase biogenesis protein [Actinomycetota bacterium]
LPSEERGFLGVSDPPPGRVTAIPRIDLERLAGQLPYPLYPLYLRLFDQQPANSGALPEPVPIPPPDEGPHRDYALQWFAFAGTALIIYLGLMRRERARLRQAGEDPVDEPDPVAA